VLIERLRAPALRGTDLAHAQIDTLRIKLLKVAAVITRNTRRIRRSARNRLISICSALTALRSARTSLPCRCALTQLNRV